MFGGEGDGTRLRACVHHLTTATPRQEALPRRVLGCAGCLAGAAGWRRGFPSNDQMSGVIYLYLTEACVARHWRSESVEKRGMHNESFDLALILMCDCQSHSLRL